MDVTALTKYNRISAQKVMEVTREIQGKRVSLALDTLKFIPRKAARLVEKTLKSAVANATNNANLNVEDLKVKFALAESGPTLKRFKPSARGMAAPRLRRTAHVRIVLSDDGAEKKAVAKAPTTAKATTAPAEATEKKAPAKKAKAKKDEPKAEATS